VLPIGAPLLFLAISFSLTLLLERSYAINSDEGYTLNAAWQVWNGMRMYRDFRQFVGPGSAYSVYLLWSVIGSPSYLAARLLSLAFSFASTTAVYLVLRRVGVRGINLAFSVFAWLIACPVYALLNHNSFSSFAATWFLLLFLRIAPQTDRPPKMLDHALVGAAAGVVFLFLQTKGLFLALGAAAFAFSAGSKRRDFRPGLALVGGFIIVVAPLFVIWSFALLVRQWFVIPLTGNYLGHTGASLTIAIPSVVGACGMGWVALRRADRVLGALAITQAALLASMSHNMEIHHLAINSFPTIIFVSVVMHERLQRTGGPARLSAEATMAIVLGAFVVGLVATPIGRDFWTFSPLYVDILKRRPRPTLFSNRRVAEAHAIYAGPFLPGLYFELKKKNPYFVSETIVCNDECQHRLVGELSATKPELAFFHYEMIRDLGYDQSSPVDLYFRERYVSCHGQNYGGLIVRASDASWCP
jgi:hypothetical protein